MFRTKLFFILFAFLLSWKFLLIRVESLDSLAGAVVYFGFLVLLLGIVYCVAFVDSFITRVFWAALLVPAFFVYEAAQRIFGGPMSYSTFVGLIAARGFVGDSVRLYGGQMVLPLLQSSFLTIGFLLRIDDRRKIKLPVVEMYPIVGTALLSVLLYLRGGFGASGLPSMFTTLSYASIYVYETIRSPDLTRHPVSLIPNRSENHEDIIVVMDESVRGDYLDINSPSGINTNLLDEHVDVHIHNYGLAASASHCSAATNLIVRYGSTREFVSTYHKSMPSIWAYAQSAGYQTVYIDAQRSGGALHNGMDSEELGYIDQFVQLGFVEVVNRDMFVIQKLGNLLANGKSDFIYVNKVGAHFPVHDKYPDEFKKHIPALPRGTLGSITDTGQRVGLFNGDWVAYKNSYKNTLLWVVGRFFQRFFDDLDLKKAIVVYTSDHGQNFHDRGEPGYNTHCSVIPVPEEGLVPLVVLVGVDVDNTGFGESAARHFNNASQFGIFSTLLELMGFDRSELNNLYEVSLFDERSLPFSFNYTFDVRLGAPHKFMNIDFEKINIEMHEEPMPN